MLDGQALERLAQTGSFGAKGGGPDRTALASGDGPGRRPAEAGGGALERPAAPIAAALLEESYPAVDERFLGLLVEAMMHVEESELAGVAGPGIIRRIRNCMT